MLLYNNNYTPTIKSSLFIWLHYIENLSLKKIDLSLERIKKVAKSLNLLTLNAIVFTISGTNGKGTTCCAIEKILISEGYQVGVYTSPHLRQYTERVRINGYILPAHKHITSFSIIESVRNNIPLTFFEYSTLSALILFKQKKLDAVILEVGLGGRFDATNIIDPNISIITNIGIDHTEILGNNTKLIGREKAGILRSNTVGILGDNIPKSVISLAKTINVILVEKNKDWNYIKSHNKWIFKDKKGKIDDLPLTKKLPLKNIAIAVAALRHSTLSIRKSTIRNTINKIFLCGRLQVIKTKPCKTVLDVAHNPHSAKYLYNYFFSKPVKGNIYAVIGMLKDKDILNTITYFLSIVDYWYCASLAYIPRGATSEEIIYYLPKEKSKTFSDPIEAYLCACKTATNKDTILVFGSFYTVSLIIQLIEYKRLYNII